MVNGEWTAEHRSRLHSGTVIPAHPLALTDEGDWDERGQRALTRYYLDAGAGGIAVGVHTTQFAIREPSVGLLSPVLELASQTVDECVDPSNPILKVAGVCGDTRQAVDEAGLARDLGYHAGLLNLSGVPGDASVEELVAHCREVASVIPVFGFYLQPTIGGRVLPYAFWRSFAEIENVVAIKIAAFNRYQTLDVIRGICDAGRHGEIALYTGNDDNIVHDLLTPYRLQTDAGMVEANFVGGLLGHWAVWTQAAVQMLEAIHAVRGQGESVSSEWLARGVAVTDMNAALFDAAHEFRGCIPGVQHVLKQQGLLRSGRCLDENEVLSEGQAEELARVAAAYPDLVDAEFVQQHRDRWLA